EAHRVLRGVEDAALQVDAEVAEALAALLEAVRAAVLERVGARVGAERVDLQGHRDGELGVLEAEGGLQRRREEEVVVELVAVVLEVERRAGDGADEAER